MMFMYCIYFTVTGFKTVFIIDTLVQFFCQELFLDWNFPISKKYSWDKFLGERLHTLADTTGGAAPLVVGVNKLGGCGEFWDSMTLSGADGLFPVCNMFWCFFLTGYMSTVGPELMAVYFMRPLAPYIQPLLLLALGYCWVFLWRLQMILWAQS